MENSDTNMDNNENMDQTPDSGASQENSSMPSESSTPPPVPTSAQEPSPANSSSSFLTNQYDLSALNRAVDEIKTEIGRKLVGQHNMVELIVVAILCDGHVLIEGVPGVAKTYTSRLVSKVINADFNRIQFTPDLMPSDVTGTNIFNMKSSEFEFKKGPIFSNIVLIDEINRAPAKTQAALFECMEEKQVSMDGTTYKLDFPFIVLATQNPVEHEGTYNLPEAQLDRFLFKINVQYPSVNEEIQILTGVSNQTISKDLSDIKNVLTKERLADFRKEVNNIRIESNLISYIVQIVDNTRKNSSLFLGASPRASIGILQASKALAAIRGRDFVTPDDIKYVAKPVLSHRIIPTPEKEMEGVTGLDVIDSILEQIEVPR